MAKIRFYADEHVPKAVTKGLIQRGIDGLTCQVADMLGATDEEHLRYAREHGYVLFTQDTDFLILHNQGVEHSGIVYAPQTKSIGHVIQGLVLVGQVLAPEDMINQVEFL